MTIKTFLDQAQGLVLLFEQNPLGALLFILLVAVCLRLRR